MTEYNNNFDREFGWDDVIEKDGGEFISLTPGDYKFTVTELERGRHTPNQTNPGKLPACPKATVSIKIETEQGEAILKHNLFLHSSTEGMLSAFFGSIGQKKHGEPLKMNWGTVIGATGVCRVNKRKGTGQYADQEFDNIKSMIYADEVDYSKVLNANIQAKQAQTPYQQPIQQATPQQPVQQQQPNFNQQPQAQQQSQGNWGGF